ncbi:MAG: hypothetical protein QW507_01240 [Candidatus Nanoarchaeia archaeon]|nr:hypothetical protein [Candidatus Haiyanarchaeum thermophilum]MCW1303440.1 hypothetical protein [Candidatus Haiyanarchaeum thermophilum]MCW1303874.1 hypothetical protein [Candidatus Haiyanarchaeum thermophilum]MCW1306859.1 hypothetical protein [Candidatus Haiyanarchaeum thermophilum]MCW1307578.1 hypothetical protein [Candidatus Haiyanarchaeum thermophilum]
MQFSILGIIFKVLDEISSALKARVRKSIVFTDTMATTLNIIIMLTLLYLGIDFFKAYGPLIILILLALLLFDLFLHNQTKFMQAYSWLRSTINLKFRK